MSKHVGKLCEENNVYFIIPVQLDNVHISIIPIETKTSFQKLHVSPYGKCFGLIQSSELHAKLFHTTDIDTYILYDEHTIKK